MSRLAGVQRGSRVTFTSWKDNGRECAGVQAGTVLDRGPGNGEWWVSVAGERGAVLVNAGAMTDSNAVGARA